jgi:hypothetical protein
MWYVDRQECRSRAAWNLASSVSAVLLAIMVGGCGSSSAPHTTTTQKRPQTYLAPLVAGSTDGESSLFTPQIYTIDDVGDTFSQSTYLLNPPGQEGAQIINSGVLSASSRGLLSLGLTAHYTFDSGAATPKWVATTYAPPKSGGLALELAGQAGGLVQLQGQPVTPLVATTQCPSNSTAQTYQFVTIPGPLFNTGAGGQQPYTWNPLSDTAYGRVDISTSGSTVNFKNIKQFTLPSPPLGGSGAPSNPSPSSVTGACGVSAYGNTISIPGQVIVTNPGPGAPPTVQAIVGIGPTGLLVEDNGLITSGGANVGAYQNTLGAGTGAVGLPRPSSPLDTGAIVGAQYLGFVYGSGVYSSGSITGGSSHLVSFGFPSEPLPRNCSSVATGTSTLIYGGDFPSDIPSSDGFGNNCDLALDLGAQDTANSGLYTNATVSIGTGYANMITPTSFPAVAIAGQLQGKFAIFVLGVDSNQSWAIYLLQSN